MCDCLCGQIAWRHAKNLCLIKSWLSDSQQVFGRVVLNSSKLKAFFCLFELTFQMLMYCFYCSLNKLENCRKELLLRYHKWLLCILLQSTFVTELTSFLDTNIPANFFWVSYVKFWLCHDQKSTSVGLAHSAWGLAGMHYLYGDQLRRMQWLSSHILNVSMVFFFCQQYTQPSPDAFRVLRGHQLSITCLCISPDDKFVFSGSKDCSIIKCNVVTFCFFLFGK